MLISASFKINSNTPNLCLLNGRFSRNVYCTSRRVINFFLFFFEMLRMQQGVMWCLFVLLMLPHPSCRPAGNFGVRHWWWWGRSWIGAWLGELRMQHLFGHGEGCGRQHVRSPVLLAVSASVDGDAADACPLSRVQSEHQSREGYSTLR